MQKKKDILVKILPMLLTFRKFNFQAALGFLFILACSFFVYFKPIDLSLSHYIQQPIFFLSSDSFTDILSMPGGFSKYLASFFSVLMTNKTLGSMGVIFLQIALIAPFVYPLSNKNKWIALGLAVVVWLLSHIMFYDYSTRIFSLVTILGGLYSTQLLLFILKKYLNPLIVVLGLLLVPALSYLLFGGLSLFIVIFSVFLHTLVHIKRFGSYAWIYFGILLIQFFIPLLLVKTIYHTLPLKEAYFTDLFFNKHYVSSNFFIALLILVAIKELLFFIINKAPKKDNNMALSIIFLVGGIILLILPVWKVDSVAKYEIENSRLIANRDWKAFLDKTEEIKNPDVFETFYTNRALYHSGELLKKGNNMAQHYGVNGLFIEQKMESSRFMPASDFYLDLGLINESRHWAHEAFTFFGMQPRILKRLVEVNIVLGKYKTANKYIQILKTSLFHSKWANEQEEFVLNPSLITDDSFYASIIAKLPTQDFLVSRAKPELNLENMLIYSSANKMAFEYLIMTHLLKHELVSMTKKLKYFRIFSYKKLPEFVQEAILLYAIKTNKKQMNLFGYQLSEQTIKRFKAYSTLYASYKKGQTKAKLKLDKEFSSTYWYYMHFVSSISKISN